MKFKGIAVKMTVVAAIIVALLVCCFVFFKDIVSAIFALLGIFAPFIIAFLISLAAKPLAKKLQKKFKLPKGLTAVIVIILIVGIVGGCLTGVIWKIVSEVKSIYIQFPEIYQNMVEWFNGFKEKLSDFYMALPEDTQEMFIEIGNNIQTSIGRFVNEHYKPVMAGAGNIAKKLPSIFIGIIVFILSLFFMISYEEGVSNCIKKIIPKRIYNSMSVVCSEIKKYLGGYVKAQLIIMSIAFVLICIGLSILGVNYAMLIALGIAMLDALPFFGSGAVLIPWSIISFISSDIKMGIGMIIIYLSIIFTRQMIEPKIVSSNIGINPILTLMSMYTGYKVFSIGGMILGPIILMLVISFYKAGAFNGIINVSKKLYLFARAELKEISDYISNK